MTSLALLPDRSVVSIDGPDRTGFLQGLVSNDVTLAVPGRAVWSALLTPQGKWLADFFVFAEGETLLLDVEAAQAADLVARLSRYRLRAKVTLAARADLRVFAAWGGDWTGGGIAAPDPRLPDAGWRILAADLPADATAADWDAHRLSLGLPDGSRDLESGTSLLLEAGFDELGGVSWSKGCFMGQELTARTKYRGLIKRRLVPVDIAGKLPPPGTPILRDGAELGTIRSGRDGRALATLRLPALSGGTLEAGGATVIPRPPAWMRLPDPVA